jgi:gamma-glutamylputrescine oxidase
VIVEPAALTIGIATAAHRAGALLCEGAPVDHLALSRAPEIEVCGHKITPAEVVVALNGWTTRLISVPEMVSALTYACATEPLDHTTLEAIGLADLIPFYTADTPYLWGRVSADGAVVFGAGLTYGGPNELAATRIEAGEPCAILGRLERRVHELHPALARVRITSRWAGPIAFRKGAVPLLLRHPEAEHVLIAGAYAGHGVAFSVHAGALMAAAIADNQPLPAWGKLNGPADAA